MGQNDSSNIPYIETDFSQSVLQRLNRIRGIDAGIDEGGNRIRDEVAVGDSRRKWDRYFDPFYFSHVRLDLSSGRLSDNKDWPR